MSNFKVQSTFKPEKEKTVAALADKMGLKLKLPCDGKGKCGKCQIQVVKGDVSQPSKEEEKHLKKSELEDGVRLACCCIPKGDVTISLELKNKK